jgi:hypothetical protein
MTNETDLPKPNEALEALTSIKNMKIAGLQRSITPWWYGIMIAIGGGIIFSLAGMEASRLYMAPFFLAMVFSTIYEARKSGVIARAPAKRTFILIIVGIISVLVPLIFVARELRDVYGLFAPLCLGILVTLVGIIACSAERYWILNKIKEEKGE